MASLPNGFVRAALLLLDQHIALIVGDETQVDENLIECCEWPWRSNVLSMTSWNAEMSSPSPKHDG